MADGYLETHYDEWLKKKEAWLKKKRTYGTSSKKTE
ncbi:MAG: dehydrogenase [Paludibacteraceae bacterium]|nr:dehydrogenase [Paludibacteraceae bacterium]